MNKVLLPKTYTPADFEEDIYYKWESSGYFNPDNLPGKRRKNFSIVLPPPNVTGALHIGHAAMLAYQDIMIRYHRLKGEKTLWLPGMDHAAIATQSVVEKDLNKEGKTRYDLGRERFLERVHQFVESAKITIRNQLKAMGSSLDWSREKFTLDKDVSYAVRIVFKKMHDDGLIYRGNRVVNWCTKCQSTLADDEVEYAETPGKLYYIKYGPLVIATSRPETKLGDTGVAVSPRDKRYQSLIGQKLTVDLAGHKLIVKVFSDRGVDPTFGTGAIGVTPAHSQQDFQWAEKYKLPVIKIIDEQGKMTANAGRYQGLTALACREQLIRDLEKSGLIEKIEDYTNNLSVCYRCATPVEPLTSQQWFVAVNKKIPGRGQSLKQLASDFVKKGKIQIIPERFNRTFFQWMDNLRDWCISRQIWYGHRIPVWYCVRNIKKMGFHESVIPQLYKGKTKTYRLRNHEFKTGDEVSFENSQTGEIFGQGEIVNIEKTIVSKINLQDKAHGAIYNSATELIKAFKKHYPNHEINTGTEVFIYTYRFFPKKSIKDSSKEIIVPRNITEIVLIRHGLTDWNKIGKYHGRTEVPLDELSIEMIKKAWPQFKKEDFDLIISSPLMRARQTAAIINEELNLPLEIDKLLTERDYGSFEGITKKEIKEKYPNYFKDKINFAIPGAESYEALGRRVEKFLKKIIKKHPNKKILLVCHTAVLRAFKMVIEGLGAADLSQFNSPFSQLTRFNLLDNNYKLTGIRQDEDTLDTWFSSSLWTFSTLGWPDKTKDLKTYHPTSVMETGYDILFFWVARMMMLSAYILKEKPFDIVYLHGLVRDKQGRKMSKSLGNGIDPLEMIKKFGADALRLSMIIGAIAGNDIKLYEEKIAGYRNFVNKLWNISRYIFSSVKEMKPETPALPASSADRPAGRRNPRPETLADQWILYEFSRIIESATKNIEEFRFSQAGEELYEFTWSKLADWYLEIAKIEKNKDEILLYILEKLLILWHPFCPFVTEVLWESFGSKELLMVQKWPQFEIRNSTCLREAGASLRRRQEFEIRDFKLIQEVVTAIRNARSEHQINPKKVYRCSIATKEEKVINENKQVIESLAKVKIVPKCAGQKIHLAQADITLDIKANQEVVKNKEKEIKNLERYIEIQQAKLNNQEFIKKAPKAVVQAEKEKLELARTKLGKLAD